MANINWYPGHMAKTKRLISEQINLIDIVYEVIDARMPLSSKIIDIEEYTKNKPKILIVSKTDLCDKKETDKWINYYKEKGYHVLSMNLEGNVNIKPLISLTEEVLEEYNQKRSDKGMMKRKARVLVVGIPNVGKSTLINRLAGKKVVNIGNKPGVTKNLNWIRVNDNIELLDSPGILWPKLEEENAFNLATFTAIREEILPLFDVVEYILRTLEKYYPEVLKERYGLDFVNDDVLIDLEEIGKKRGCLIKGGEIDYDKVMGLIMSDVKNGYIKGITFDRFDG
ncbi:MAG: ribosome biogenesis GTPase YlqF [Bacilli bacterium]|nr:ribosome biogenesis GTPase YlqF [Bacilli bacterium]